MKNEVMYAMTATIVVFLFMITFQQPAEVIAQTTNDDSRMVWLTTRSSGALEIFSNNNLDSGDLIVYHFGLGRDPTTQELQDLDDVTSVPDSRKGLEFFSLAELEEHAPSASTRGFGFISYDLEAVSPDSEEADPVGSIQQAKEIADANNLDLMVAPSNEISSTYSDDIAPYVDRYHLQSQPLQDDDATCQTLVNWMNQEISDIENANSSLAGEITAQVTITGNAASGKTAFQTAQDCMNYPMVSGNGNADGLTIFWNGATWDDGSFESLLAEFEATYS